MIFHRRLSCSYGCLLLRTVLCIGSLQITLLADKSSDSVFNEELSKPIEFITSDSDPNTVHGFNPNRSYQPTGVTPVVVEEKVSLEETKAMVEAAKPREIDAPTAAKAKEVYLQLRNSTSRKDIIVEEESAPVASVEEEAAEFHLVWWLGWLIGCILGLVAIVILFRIYRNHRQQKRRSRRRSALQPLLEKSKAKSEETRVLEAVAKGDAEDEPSGWHKKPKKRRSSKSRSPSGSKAYEDKPKEAAFFKKEGPIKQSPPKRPARGSHGPMPMPYGMPPPGMPMHPHPPRGGRGGPPPQIIYVPVMHMPQPPPGYEHPPEQAPRENEPDAKKPDQD